MGITAIGGFLLVLAAIVVSTIVDGNSFGPLISPSSFVLVMGCTVGSAIFSYELSDVVGLPKVVLRAIRRSSVDHGERIAMYMALADSARREGLLALDAKIDDIEDPYIQHGLRLVTDGADEEQLRSELDAYMSAVEDRHAAPAALLRKLAAYAPSFGMVGTVIGLVNMLGSLDNPSQLGSGMALALLTTLYGVVFANVLFQPLAERLENLHSAEMLLMSFDTDAICALQTGVSPRAMVSHLESLLPPGERQGYDERLQEAA